MPDREQVLHKVRTALGRRRGQPPDPPPALSLAPVDLDLEERVRLLIENFPGQCVRAASPEEACRYVSDALAGCRAVASNASFLQTTGITSLPGVESNIRNESTLRQLAAEADVGITSADYALADPGALVLLSMSGEDRIVSLLPPVHIAVIPAGCILAGIDDLFSALPDPAAVSSCMVIIGGPSRTGDIEMSLVLGVHGPRELHLVVV